MDIHQYFKSSEYCEASDIKFSLNDIKVDSNEYDNFMDVTVN